MNSEGSGEKRLDPQTLIEVVIRLAVMALLVYLCFRVVQPFMPLMLWGLILAIMFYPAHQKLAAMLGGRQGRASTLIVLLGCAILIVPMVQLSGSLVDHVQEANTKLQNNELSLKPPSPKVQEWPFIGERVYALWSEASDNVTVFVEKYQEQIQGLLKKAMASARGALATVGVFIGALIVAGIMMAWGESGSKAMLRITSRFAGEHNGPALQALSVGTVRSVAAGVLGVAVIQALLFGVGFMVAGIPGAGILALLVLMVGIIQLPALIVSIPVIAFIWSGDGSSAANIAYTLYFIVAGFSDNALKPLLLGRGVDAPMPIILIGALGGMVVSGFIGLFLGATLLAVGYKLFMGWVDHVWLAEFD
jgi:predicted PurR-regulated permease PerM